MPHENSVLHQVLQLVPWDEFDRAVARHGADDGARGFNSRSHLVALIYAQLSGAVSLREIEAGLKSHSGRLYHVGLQTVRRSTLADANRYRPSAVFTDLFAAMALRLARRERRSLAEVTYLIDSTVLPLTAKSADWAHFSTKLCGAKLHVVYDVNAERPVYTEFSSANVNDITIAQDMPVEPGATYVFDLGYYDYGWWAKLDAAQCRIVSRLKTNTPLTLLESMPVKKDGPIVSDRIGFLPERQAKSRTNPMGNAIREVKVRIETGKVLRIFSNDLDAPAQEIADLYKRRWAIELFFRWIKQTLRITRFLGTTENAIKCQVAAALISYLLLRLAQATQRAIKRPLDFVRLIRLNIMHIRPVIDLLTPQTRKPKPVPNQLCLKIPNP